MATQTQWKLSRNFTSSASPCFLRAQFILRQMHWTNLSVSIEAKYWVSWLSFDVYERVDGLSKLPLNSLFCAVTADSNSRWPHGETRIPGVSSEGVDERKLLVVFADVDECQLDLCEHECVNSKGSYQCFCPAGYQLAADRHTCEGTGSRVICRYINAAKIRWSPETEKHVLSTLSGECNRDRSFCSLFSARRKEHLFRHSPNSSWCFEHQREWPNSPLPPPPPPPSPVPSPSMAHSLVKSSSRQPLLFFWPSCCMYISTFSVYIPNGWSVKQINVIFRFTDINECATKNGGCGHQCINVNGRYEKKRMADLLYWMKCFWTVANSHWKLLKWYHALIYYTRYVIVRRWLPVSVQLSLKIDDPLRPHNWSCCITPKACYIVLCSSHKIYALFVYGVYHFTVPWVLKRWFLGSD